MSTHFFKNLFLIIILTVSNCSSILNFTPFQVTANGNKKRRKLSLNNLFTLLLFEFSISLRTGTVGRFLENKFCSMQQMLDRQKCIKIWDWQTAGWICRESKYSDGSIYVNLIAEKWESWDVWDQIRFCQPEDDITPLKPPGLRSLVRRQRI